MKFKMLAILLIALITTVSFASSEKGASRSVTGELLKSLDFDYIYDQMISKMIETAVPGVLETFDKIYLSLSIPQERQAEAMKLYADERVALELRTANSLRLTYNKQKMFNEVFIPAYQKEFTEEEANEIADFFKSPIGAKYIDKRSEIIASFRGEFDKYKSEAAAHADEDLGDLMSFLDKLDKLCGGECQQKKRNISMCDDSDVPCTAVIVASKDLAVGDEINEDSVAVRRIPDSYIHSLALPPEKYEKINKKHLRFALKNGDLIMTSMIEMTVTMNK